MWKRNEVEEQVDLPNICHELEYIAEQKLRVCIMQVSVCCFIFCVVALRNVGVDTPAVKYNVNSCVQRCRQHCMYLLSCSKSCNKALVTDSSLLGPSRKHKISKNLILHFANFDASWELVL